MRFGAIHELVQVTVVLGLVFTKDRNIVGDTYRTIATLQDTVHLFLEVVL